MINFHVGMKVVCVDASPADDGYVTPLARGRVYTIVDINIVPDVDGNIGLRLAEVSVPIRVTNYFYLDTFRAKRFRPVIERKTNISVLTALLNPNRRKLEPA